MKHGIRTMLAGGHGGAIVNWSSVGGLGASTFGTVYAASKAGVISATKSAAVEYGDRGIRVNAICPGFILTEIMGAAGAEHFPEMFAKAALGRAGEPHEVAEVAAFLASDDAVVRLGRDRARRRRLVGEAGMTATPPAKGAARYAGARVPRRGRPAPHRPGHLRRRRGLPGMLHACFVRSPFARAAVRGSTRRPPPRCRRPLRASPPRT